MANNLYVDVPGLRREARRSVLAPAGTEWGIDLGQLCELVAALTSPLDGVVLCGDGPAAEDTLPVVLRASRCTARIVGRTAAEDETQVLGREILSSPGRLVPGGYEATVVSGDARLVAAIERLRADGVAVHLFFFVRAPRRLRQAATAFWGLDGWLYRLVTPEGSV